MKRTQYADEDCALFYDKIEGINVGYSLKNRTRKVKFWSIFVNDGDGFHQIGPRYPSEKLLLADLHRYATEYGF